MNFDFEHANFLDQSYILNAGNIISCTLGLKNIKGVSRNICTVFLREVSQNILTTFLWQTFVNGTVFMC